MLETGARSAMEALTPEREHLLAKRAFKDEAAAFDALLKMENAWHNMGNWLSLNRSPRVGHQEYHFSVKAKMAAVDRMVAAYHAVGDAFDSLPEESRESLAGRPIITFDCEGDEKMEPSSFEFNLPEIIAGWQALGQLGRLRDIRCSTDVLRIRPEDTEAYSLARQSLDLLYASVDSAAEFLTAGKYTRRHPIPNYYYFGASRQLTRHDQLAIARVDRAEKLGEVYIGAVSNGDRPGRAALQWWLAHVNNKILITAATPSNMYEAFGIHVDVREQNIHPYESSMVPVGKTLVLGKNARERDYENSLWP